MYRSLFVKLRKTTHKKNIIIFIYFIYFRNFTLISALKIFWNVNEISLTRHVIPARRMQFAGKKLEANNCVNNYDENNEQRYVQQRYHRPQYGIQHNLETYKQKKNYFIF